MSDWHDWLNWEQYLSVHHSYMDHYRDYFILDDRLNIQQGPDVVRWTGELICSDGFEIHVDKRQDVQYVGSQPRVRTAMYSYQVLQRLKDRVVNHFRYDNVHIHDGHPDSHHRHQYDTNNEQLEPPAHVGAESWPSLGEVIDETYRLWEQSRPE